MKKLLFLAITAMAIPAFIACSSDDDDNNNNPIIDDSPAIVFTDADFERYCLYAYEFDKNRDGKISEREAAEVTRIECPSYGIQSLADLKYFPNLEELNCYNNQLTTLDVSKNTKLKELSCPSNQLTTLNLSKNTELTYLSCGSNNLMTLNLSKNTELTYLSCPSNQLTTLNLSKNTELTYLSCGSNNLMTLDVSKNTALTYLSCSGNNNFPELWLANGQAIPYLSKDIYTVIKRK